MTGKGRDAGFTLPEVIIVIVVTGLIVVVLGAAINVIFRNESGIVTAVGEAHDVQQAVNYFHFDVESGPAESAAYRLASGGASGTGCADAGSANVFRYDTADLLRYDNKGRRRVAELLVVGASDARLDRYTCVWDSGSGSWVQESVLNIADRLPATSSAVTVAVDATAGLVDQATMRFAQSVSTRAMTATPRAEAWLAAGAEPCGQNPLAAVLGFETFVEGDVRLNGGELEGSLAVGGKLSWGNATIGVATSNTNSGAFTNVALFATEVDWAASDPAGVLTTANGGSKRVALGGSYVVDSSGNPKKIYAAMPYGGANIATRGSAVATSGYTLDFSAQFVVLRKCADALAALPNGAVAAHATLLDPGSGGPYPGIGDPTGNEVMLRFEDDSNGDVATAVLNVSESQLAALDTVLRENGSSLSAARPLIVNVHDDDGDGNVTFDFDSTAWTNVGDAKRVIFNFPNAVGTVTIVREAYGAVFAPYADVITNDLVQGQIVARTWTHQGGVVKSGPEYKFTGGITWT